MYIQPSVKSRSLGGSSDLTIVAPLKQGLIPSLDAVTYRTRTKRLLQALHRGRASAHEYALSRPISDAVERVGLIQSVRVVVIEPCDAVMLSVSFDGAWESYLRVIWQKVGALLDLIFCGTQGWVSAAEGPFEAWRNWVVEHQVESDFFYGPAEAGTVSDLLYARHALRSAIGPQSCSSAGDAAAASVSTAEDTAWDVLENWIGTGYPAGHVEVARQGLQSLAALYALTDWFLPRSEEGACLHRAARLLLAEFDKLRPRIEDEINRQADRFGAALRWLTRAPAGPARTVPESATKPLRSTELQAGVLSAYPEGYHHGALLLLAFADAAAAAAFLSAIAPSLARDEDVAAGGRPMRTLALSVDGLRAGGLGDEILRMFPIEFVQGMAARAGTLGDLRTNHPRRWRLPERVDRTTLLPLADTAIEWAQVHAVLQIRARATTDPERAAIELWQPDHPLHADVVELAAQWHAQGVELLAVQSMRRNTDPESGVTREHFGYIDDKGQPDVDGDLSKADPVHPGEFVIGYDTAADAATPLSFGLDPVERERREWLNDGSFLVLRKISQNVELFDRLVPGAEERAKLLGRRVDGSPLVLAPGDLSNRFDYVGDPRGTACPLHAHIRRVHPRLRVRRTHVEEPPGGRAPRLLRRGMSYGPQYVPNASSEADIERNRAPRGLVFMAFNSSIGEQFEVVQRWLVGGNSSGSTSIVSDPFVGVPGNGERRSFRYVEQQGSRLRARRVALDGSDALFDEPELLTRLEWGAYLFVPSLRAIDKLAEHARRATIRPAVEWSAARGAAAIERLRRIETTDGADAAAVAWKAALEDPDAIDRFEAASIWAAVRRAHGGALKTPYGVLVADRQSFDRVLGAGGAGRYSVRGYLPRMHDSIGPIYLGLDDEGAACPYRRDAGAANAAIMAVQRSAAFAAGRHAAKDALDGLIASADVEHTYDPSDTFEMHFDLREVVDQSLGRLCERWFALVPDANWERGGLRADWRPGEALRYPGHFTAPSRYIFQPNPTPAVAEIGSEFGSALRLRMRLDIAGVRQRSAALVDPIGVGLMTAVVGTLAQPKPDDDASRNLIGVMMGFLPTSDGALRRLLSQWLADGTFWALRTRVQAQPVADLAASQALLGAALRGALALRPAPEAIWRTATCPHRLGPDAEVEAGDRVVLAIASATQQAYEAGISDDDALMPMFGGARSTPVDAWPTHACPGFEAAIGLLHGVALALLECNASMRAGPTTTSLTITRTRAPAPAPQPLTTALSASTTALEASALSGLATAAGLSTTRFLNLNRRSILSITNPPANPITTGHLGNLACWGDSWLTWLNGHSADLAEALDRTGFKRSIHVSSPGLISAEMAKDAADPASEFLALLRAALQAPATRPKAIVLSVGGNDCKGSALKALLRMNDQLSPKYFVAGQPEGFIDDLFDKMVRIIDGLLGVGNIGDMPIIVHGYGNPVPDGRGIMHLPSMWLKPPIEQCQYAWQTEGVEIMQTLIGHLNDDVMRELERRYPKNVRYVDLRAQLSNVLANDAYKGDWYNELHLTGAGYAKAAEAIVQVIER